MSFVNGQMIFQSLMATDYGRFAHPRFGYRGTLAIMLLELVPMFIFIFIGGYLGQTLVSHLGESKAQDPGFVFVKLLGFSGVIFVIITQIRINVMNFYSGSLQLASGFDATLNFRPGRPWWMFFILIAGIICYAFNVINFIPTFLAITGILTNTWVLIILSDYWICRKLLKLAPSHGIAYETNKVREWNPCGLISLGVAVFIGFLGIVGAYPGYYSSFIAMFSGPIVHVGITVLTQGKFYETKYDIT
jgi:purine-cytosine permease-like protein